MGRGPLYSQGVCEDGAAILKDGTPMTVDQVITELNNLSFTVDLLMDKLAEHRSSVEPLVPTLNVG